MVEDFRKIKKEIVKLILTNPKARERKYRNKAVGSVIIKKYGLSIDQETMAQIVKDIENGTRSWRAFLEENPKYRGSDYGDKVKLEQAHQLELGYVPGIDEQQKILEQL